MAEATENATPVSVPAELERKIDEAISHYPADRKRSASMPLLHLWQEHFGFISDEGVEWIARKLELQPINILELVTFYPMYRQQPAGKTHIRVCRTLSCAMNGSYQVMENACAAAGIHRRDHTDDNGMHNPISVSADGDYSIEFVECLASCGTAPVAMVQDELVENIDPSVIPSAVEESSSLPTRGCLDFARHDREPQRTPHPLERRLI